MSAEVEVTINQRSYNFQEDIRLSTALSIVALKEDWYWPASSFFRSSPEDSYYSRDKIAERLKFKSSVINFTDSESREIKKVLLDMLQWQYAERIEIRVHYDLARIKREYDPLLTDGNYHINLQTRPEYIDIIGAVNDSGKYHYKVGEQPEYYLEQAGVMGISNMDYVYVLEPTGVGKKIGIAYWNKENVAIMPGSTIVGLISESSFSDLESKFNEVLIDLARNRLVSP